ncbi:MAG: nucleoside-diphosphate kinase [Planctomycetota bacterium]
MEETLVFLKPDAVQRGLTGEIISRFEKRGLQIIGLKMLQLDESFVRDHYAAHEGKHFYEPLVRYIIAGPIVAMVVKGKNAIQVVRNMMGETFGGDSAPGTIRGDYAVSDRYNLIHGSDSPEAARKEIDRFFTEEELVEHPPEALEWIYDMSGERTV